MITMKAKEMLLVTCWHFSRGLLILLLVIIFVSNGAVLCVLHFVCIIGSAAANSFIA